MPLVPTFAMFSYTRWFTIELHVLSEVQGSIATNMKADRTVRTNEGQAEGPLTSSSMERSKGAIKTKHGNIE